MKGTRCRVVQINLDAVGDVHVVSSVFKWSGLVCAQENSRSIRLPIRAVFLYRFLRQLPDPLLTFRLYQPLVRIAWHQLRMRACRAASASGRPDCEWLCRSTLRSSSSSVGRWQGSLVICLLFTPTCCKGDETILRTTLLCVLACDPTSILVQSHEAAGFDRRRTGQSHVWLQSRDSLRADLAAPGD